MSFKHNFIVLINNYIDYLLYVQRIKATKITKKLSYPNEIRHKRMLSGSKNMGMDVIKLKHARLQYKGTEINDHRRVQNRSIAY
ncbi:MAG: hypothetical protein CL663_05475 [Bacteroidetes bacterium]|nr:hypothetical protein [Bacteroidota bacterium]